MAASSNGTPCLSLLLFAFRGSHSNIHYVYTIDRQCTRISYGNIKPEARGIAEMRNCHLE